MPINRMRNLVLLHERSASALGANDTLLFKTTNSTPDRVPMRTETNREFAFRRKFVSWKNQAVIDVGLKREHDPSP